MPPVYIFPRIRYKDYFLNGAPEASLGLGSKTGWMTAELFVKVLSHIQKNTLCTTANPILLIMDNHISHVSIDSINFAKSNGIVLLSFPPHCSHRMQPLDVGIYSPFKSALKYSFNDWMAANPGKPISIQNIAALSKLPFSTAFSIKNITSSFEKTGIWPINSQIFGDDDFISSYSTDRPDPNLSISINALPSNVMPSKDSNEPGPSNLIIEYREKVVNNNLIVTQIDNNIGSEMAGPSRAIEQQYSLLQSPSYPKEIGHNQCKVLETIKPFPKAAPRVSNRKTKKQKSTIYTETPEKNKIEQLANERKNKIKKKNDVQKKKSVVPKNIINSQVNFKFYLVFLWF